jgi:peptide chain release factor 1
MPTLPDLASFRGRLAELDRAMAEPDFYGDRRSRGLRHARAPEADELLEKSGRFQALEKQIADNREIAEQEEDAELKAMALEEIPSLEEKLNALYETILSGMIPPEPSDSRNTIIEIRAGTGGDEASLFAADLFRMYSRYAEDRG